MGDSILMAKRNTIHAGRCPYMKFELYWARQENARQFSNIMAVVSMAAPSEVTSKHRARQRRRSLGGSGGEYVLNCH
jgi:hypothetical protein